MLFYFHGMDISAAAVSLGLPESTLKARLHRGREILRTRLPHTFEGGPVKDADMDRLFSQDGDIEPSSGFTARVMEALRHDASIPPPIPFPWKFALPGLSACAMVLTGLFVASFTQPGSGALPTPIPAATGVLAAATGWVALALLLSFISITLSTRLARRITD